MEVSGAAGGAAKRKREATPDADLCCDICHEVRCRHHYWREVALAASEELEPFGSVCVHLRSACRLPPVASVPVGARRLPCGRGLPAQALGVGFLGAERLAGSVRREGSCQQVCS